jgi:Baseplate J-like protein
VSILGITRKTSELATGLVTFFRETAVKGVVAIPQGLPLSTTKGEVFFETTQPRILQEGQGRIDAPVRAAEAFRGELGIVPAGAITEMVQPLAGISRVTNLDPTIRAAEDETDEELRLRARAVLRALGKATLAALDRVIREGRGTPVEFWDPNSPPERRTDPGTVAILVQAEPERFPSLRAAVEETRAAGVVTTLVARYVFFKLRVAAKITPGLTAAGKEKVKEEMLAALQEYVDGLSSGEPADGAALKEKLKGVEDVSNPVFREVLTWRSDIGRPSDIGGSALVEALVGAATAASSGGTAALKDALALILAGAPPTAPTGARIADRSLLQSTGGGPATDENVEKAEFRIAATVAGEPWWVVLDMQPSDILLEEG